MITSEIVSLLPPGAQTRIARRVGVSKQAVNKALQGKLGGMKAVRIIKEAEIEVIQQQRLNRAKQERARIAALSDDELLHWLDEVRLKPSDLS